MSLEKLQQIALVASTVGDGLSPTEMVRRLMMEPEVTEHMANQALKHLFEKNLIELSGDFKLVATPLGLLTEQHRMDPIPPQPQPQRAHDKTKPKKTKSKLSLNTILDGLESSAIGDLLIGVGAGLNAVKEARKKRKGAEIEAEDFDDEEEE